MGSLGTGPDLVCVVEGLALYDWHGDALVRDKIDGLRGGGDSLMPVVET